MTLPPELDAIWRGNPPVPESLIMATYAAGIAKAERDRDSWRRIAEKLQEELENERKTIVYIGKKI